MLGGKLVSVLLLLSANGLDAEPTAFNVAPIYGEEALTTQTVFGFGDYVTTVGNTVMFFTPKGGPGSGFEASSTLSLENLFEEQKTRPFIEVGGVSSDYVSEIQPSSTSALYSQEDENYGTQDISREEFIEQEVEEEPRKTERPSINKVVSSKRKTAISSFKERLAKRVEKAKLEENYNPRSSSNSVRRSSFKSKSAKLSRGSSEPYFIYDGEEDQTEAPRPRTFRSRISRTRDTGRSFRTREGKTEEEAENKDDDEEEENREGFGRSTSGFGRRRNSRPETRRPSFTRNKIRESLRESLRGNSRSDSRSDSRSSSSSTLDRLSSFRPSSRKESKTTEAPKPSQPTSSSKLQIKFKKFNRFDRPDIRKDLFRKRPTSPPKKVEDENTEDALSSPSALVPSIIHDEDILQNIDNPEIRLERLKTTLLVSTVYPEKSKDNYLEIATIRSPYTFEVENNEKSTRFITVTRTFSKSLETTEAPASSIRPTPSQAPAGISKTPIFDTKSIPAPENILATTDYKDIITGSQSVETLPAVILPTSLYRSVPPFKTVTESFSTEELMIKKSILPVIIGSETSDYTLSQTYSVTRYVTATKTIPPMEFYEFSPSKSFADFDALFEEAGSENREQLLPGELEFSDQDNFGLEGPSPVRVTPPPGFVDDLDLIGAKLDFVNHMEQKHNPEIFNLKNPPTIQSSINQQEQFAIAPSKTVSTPSLPQPSINGFNISPEQLLYLQLLQNPLAALGLAGGLGANLGGGLDAQVVTESKPVYRTETVFETSKIKLFQGAKEFTTTLVNAAGVTTITDYELTTKTINPGFGGLGSGLSGTQQSPTPGSPLGAGSPLGGLFQPSYTVVSSPVIRNTVQTQTITEELRVIFRNAPKLTTITSTKLVSTQVTSFITKTQRVQPTANPFAGLLG